MVQEAVPVISLNILLGNERIGYADLAVHHLLPKRADQKSILIQRGDGGTV